MKRHKAVVAVDILSRKQSEGSGRSREETQSRESKEVAVEKRQALTSRSIYQVPPLHFS